MEREEAYKRHMLDVCTTIVEATTQSPILWATTVSYFNFMSLVDTPLFLRYLWPSHFFASLSKFCPCVVF
jgi:hypothetical protein